jgi:tetratricopeptide (TPR) repeat protein
MCTLLLALSCSLTAGQASGQTANEDLYKQYFAAAEQAKKSGDNAAMEQNLKLALQNGPGDEYAWRSLAWAQMNQGKWRESLATAKENIKRNGECSWSLKQLFASALAGGDLDLARETVARMDKLPADKRNAETFSEHAELQRLTHRTVLDITYRIIVADYDLQDGTLYIQPPIADHLWQKCTTTVEGVSDWKLVKDGRWDVLVIRPGDVKEFSVKCHIIHTPNILGWRKLALDRDKEVPAELKLYLGPFINHSSYDPQGEVAQNAVRDLRGKTLAETAQNILDWVARNMRYERVRSDKLEDLLAGHKGLCHDYSNLTVALCRAAGVPALVAHGSAMPSRGSFRDIAPSHGWVELYLGELGWVPADPLDPNSLRCFRAPGYVIVDTSSHTPDDNHFYMRLQDGHHLDSIQGAPASGTAAMLKDK